MGGADSTCRRRRRRSRRSKPAWDVSVGAADYTDNATTSATTLCFLEPDPLVLAMCASTGPPAWVVSFALMLEELVTLLIVS